MLVKVFSALIGLALIAFGLAVGIAGQGAAPCGRFCGLQQSVVFVLGQQAHNFLFGLLWVAAGMVFLCIPWLRKRLGGPRGDRPQV